MKNKPQQIIIAKEMISRPPDGLTGIIPVGFDPDVLRTSHLLITGVSGSGKSYANRVLSEKTCGILPMFIIDPEGEYASLREKFSFVLVAEGGDIPIHPSTARTMVRRLMALNVSAIFDLSSMNAEDQHLWVKNFCEGLIAIPRAEWHPLVMLIDEAHLFCPQHGEGESIAHAAMCDVAKRGRKRGFMNVWATQRLSSLDKNAAAELQNTMIGRTTLHNDRERVAKILGVTRKEKEQFFIALKTLRKGFFYFQGIAVIQIGGDNIPPDMILAKVDEAQTKHPEPGSPKEITFPTPAQIKALLPELSAITKDAISDEKKKRDLETENATLRDENNRLLLALENGNPPTASQAEDIAREARESEAQRWEQEISRLRLDVLTHASGIVQRVSVISELAGKLDTLVRNPTSLEAVTQYKNLGKEPNGPRPPRTPRAGRVVVPREGDKKSKGPGRAERRILRVLSLSSNGCSRERLAIRIVYARTGGGFKKALSNLRTWGMIEKDDPIKITQAGRAAAHDPTPKPGIDLVNEWMKELGKAEKALFAVIIPPPPFHVTTQITKEEAGKRAGYEHTGGSFKRAISTLRTLGLVDGKEKLSASVHLFGRE